MYQLLKRLVKVGMLAGFVVSVVASVKATIAANARPPRENAPDA